MMDFQGRVGFCFNKNNALAEFAFGAGNGFFRKKGHLLCPAMIIPQSIDSNVLFWHDPAT